MSQAWTKQQREAVREYLTHAQPHNAAILVGNIEDFMPKQIRAGFEAMFAKLVPAPEVSTNG